MLISVLSVKAWARTLLDRTERDQKSSHVELIVDQSQIICIFKKKTRKSISITSADWQICFQILKVNKQKVQILTHQINY